MLVLLAGSVFFSRYRYDWVRHQLIDIGGVQWPALLLPMIVALLVGCGTGRGERDARGRLGDGAFAVIATLLLLAQWWTAANSPWLLYAWIASVVALAAGRLGHWLPIRPGPARALAIVALLSAVATAVHVQLQLDLWRNMSFGYHDIGLFARALHNGAARKGLWVESLGRSILGEHAFLAAWPLAWICRLGADPFLLLIVLGPLALNGAGIVVAWFTWRRLESAGAALIAGLAWILLPMHGCLIVAHGYGFHESYLAAPLLAAGFGLGFLGRHRVAAIVLLTSMLIREDIALTVAAWGVYVCCVDRRRRVGLGTAAVAAAWFALAVFAIVPACRGEPYPHMGFHFRDALGTTAAGMAINASFLVTLLLPMAFLPLRGWRFALVSLPALAETLLTKNPELHNLGFHYYVPAMVVLFFAAVEGWRCALCGRVTATGEAPREAGNSAPRPCEASACAAGEGGGRESLSRSALRPGSALLAAALLGQAYLGAGAWTSNPAIPTAHPALIRAYEPIVALREQIPPTAGVTASYRIAAHFLDAAALWTTANEQLGDFVIVHHADVIDERRPRDALVRALATGAYRPIYADHHLVALAHTPTATPLSERLRPAGMPDDVPRVSLELGEGIELAGMLARPDARRGQVRVTMIWRCTATVERDLRFGLTLGDSRWGPFYFAHGAYPTNTWRVGEHFRDDVTLDMGPGEPSRIAALRPVLLE